MILGTIALHGARAGARRNGHAGSGRLRARRAAVRAGHRPSSVHGRLADRHAARAAAGQRRSRRRWLNPELPRAHRSVDSRIAPEGSPAAAGRERGHVPAESGARFDGRHGARERHGRAAAARDQREHRRARAGARRAPPGVRSRAARHADDWSSSPAKPASARRRSSKHSSGTSRRAAKRSASGAADARSGWPAARPTCQYSKRSTACSGTSSSAACRA